MWHRSFPYQDHGEEDKELKPKEKIKRKEVKKIKVINPMT
jgi:hypothetical protein